MNYTHYYLYSGDFDERYIKIINDIIFLIEKYKTKYNLNFINSKYYLILNDSQCDKGDNFVLSKSQHYLLLSPSCKTNKLPYDDIVTACLIILAHLPEVDIASNGSITDWIPGRKLVDDTFPDKYDSMYIEFNKEYNIN